MNVDQVNMGALFSFRHFCTCGRMTFTCFTAIAILKGLSLMEVYLPPRSTKFGMELD